MGGGSPPGVEACLGHHTLNLFVTGVVLHINFGVIVFGVMVSDRVIGRAHVC